MLKLEELSCGYGKIEAVRRLSLEVENESIVALVGANGAGKSSTIQCIAGHVQRTEGRILFDGEDITALSPQERVRRGIAVAPEGRRLFRDLTVRENLTMGGYCRPKEREKTNFERVMEIFPRLTERINSRAEHLSGGEQQMVTIGRAMMSEPRILMIDEVSLGLMPKNVDICYDAIRRLRSEGLSILLVEQNTVKALDTADRVFVLESGRLVWKGDAAAAKNDASIVEAYMGGAKA
jgi:branched-chain amino acid transport system ATP-binding protein